MSCAIGPFMTPRLVHRARAVWAMMTPRVPARGRGSSLRCRVTSVLSSYLNYRLVKDRPGSPPHGVSSDKYTAPAMGARDAH